MIMISIATLGPKNTFSEMAAKAYISYIGQDADIQLFPTIKKAFSAVGNECSLGILPIENMLEGYVQPVLDLLLNAELKIIDELLLTIHFSFAANCKSQKDVKKVYAQFVTQGQCSDFLDSIHEAELITTQSNGDSLDRVLEGEEYVGAIVPSHTLKTNSFPFMIENVNDYKNNQTRFIIISDKKPSLDESRGYKTSLVIVEGIDRPGLLSDILAAFSKRNINLVSIMSRPTKESLGKYHFFIDIEGHSKMPHIQEALEDIRVCGDVKLLGSYPKARKADDGSTAFAKILKTKIGNNPFFQTSDRPAVSVSGGDDPYTNTINALSSFDLSVVRGKKVLLKPNAGRVASAESGIVTNPHVVAAAVDEFRKAGAEVTVGESPITGTKTIEAFEAGGIAEVCRDRECTLIDMDRRPPVNVNVSEGRLIRTLKVCAYIFDFDIIVSIPVMKTHMHTGVTLSVKNMKGCLWRKSKVDFHKLPIIPGSTEKSLNIAIADMSSILRPHFTIIDGTVGMEGLGPSAGEPKEVGLVIAGVDPFAADSVAFRLMGIDPKNVPHLKMGAERGYGKISLKELSVTPSDWQKLITPFAQVPDNLSITFPNVKILDENSCSACQSTLLVFLKRFGEEMFDYFTEEKPVSIAIGEGHGKIAPPDLCIGSCTRKFSKDTIFVTGCPPVASAVLKEIKDNR